MSMRSLGSLRRRAVWAHLIQRTAEGLVTELGARVHYAESLADDVSAAALSCSDRLDERIFVHTSSRPHSW